MSEGRFIERGRELLRALGTLGEERVKNHAVTEERFQTATRTSQEAYDDALTGLRERESHEGAGVRRTHRERQQEIEDGAERRLEKTRRTYEYEKDSITSKAEKNAAEARRKMEEATWVAETVYEAGEGKSVS